MRKLYSLLLICVLSAPAASQTLSGGAKLSQGAKIQRVASGCADGAPCTGILDNFNRADGGPPLSANWGDPLLPAQSTSWEVNSSVAFSIVSGSTYWNTSFNADQEVFFDTVTSATGFELHLNIASPGVSGMDSVAVYYSGTAWVWYEYTNATATALGPGCADISFSYTTGDKFWLRRNGTTLTLARAASGSSSWSDLGPCTDSLHNVAGYIGVAQYGGGTEFDSFGGGNR